MKYLKDVVTLSLSPEKCVGCGLCVQVCARGVWGLNEGRAMLLDRDRCIECGACEKNCAFGAISVKPGVGCAAAMFNGLLRTGDPAKGCCGSSGGGGCC